MRSVGWIPPPPRLRPKIRGCRRRPASPFITLEGGARRCSGLDSTRRVSPRRRGARCRGRRPRRNVSQAGPAGLALDPGISRRRRPVVHRGFWSKPQPVPHQLFDPLDGEAVWVVVARRGNCRPHRRSPSQRWAVSPQEYTQASVFDREARRRRPNRNLRTSCTGVVPAFRRVTAPTDWTCLAPLSSRSKALVVSCARYGFGFRVQVASVLSMAARVIRVAVLLIRCRRKDVGQYFMGHGSG